MNSTSLLCMYMFAVLWTIGWASFLHSISRKGASESGCWFLMIIATIAGCMMGMSIIH